MIGRAQSVRAATLAATVVSAVACQERSDVVVFYAASLARSFAELGEAFLRQNPTYRVRLEPSGSQVVARKISEMHMRADVVASADASVIDRILIPEHATWNVLFATNEIVVAHRSHSAHTETITAENWPSILLRGDVRLGCVDPDLAPIGYRTFQVWQLAEKHYAHRGAFNALAERLTARCAKEHVMPNEGELLRLLSARAVDYAMMYRSTAEDHRLKITTLPAAINLGDPSAAAGYRRASARVRMTRAASPVAITATPIFYGVTVPTSAPNPHGGRLFLRLLLSETGQRILRRRGFSPLSPPLARNLSAVPAVLSERLEAETPSKP